MNRIRSLGISTLLVACSALAACSANSGDPEPQLATAAADINVNPAPVLCRDGSAVLPGSPVVVSAASTASTIPIQGSCPLDTTTAPNLATTVFDDYYDKLLIPFMAAVDQCYGARGITLHDHLKARFPWAFADEAFYLTEDGDDLKVTQVLFEYILEARRDVYDAWQADPQCPGASLEGYVKINAPDLYTVIRADNSQIASRVPVSDFDGDAIADYGVVTPTTNYWTTQQSSTAQQAVYISGGTGQIVPGDYDGDGRTDPAQWDPSTGNWHWRSSANGAVNNQQWGLPGDLPVANDFDGDGKTDYAVWRPSNGTWYVLTRAGATLQRQWGTAGDAPVTGDYDADGKADFAVWRPSEGRWWIIDSSTNNIETYVLGSGANGDVSVPGDYDGDSITDIAVVKLSTGHWTIRQSSNGALRTENWGTTGDVRAANDFDGDGATDVGVWRNSTGQWFHFQSAIGGQIGPPFGHAGDLPISSAFMY